MKSAEEERPTEKNDDAILVVLLAKNKKEMSNILYKMGFTVFVPMNIREEFSLDDHSSSYDDNSDGSIESSDSSQLEDSNSFTTRAALHNPWQYEDAEDSSSFEDDSISSPATRTRRLDSSSAEDDTISGHATRTIRFCLSYNSASFSQSLTELEKSDGGIIIDSANLNGKLPPIPMPSIGTTHAYTNCYDFAQMFSERLQNFVEPKKYHCIYRAQEKCIEQQHSNADKFGAKKIGKENSSYLHDKNQVFIESIIPVDYDYLSMIHRICIAHYYTKLINFYLTSRNDNKVHSGTLFNNPTEMQAARRLIDVVECYLTQSRPTTERVETCNIKDLRATLEHGSPADIAITLSDLIHKDLINIAISGDFDKLTDQEPITLRV